MREKKDNEKPKRRGRPQRLDESVLAKIEELASANLSTKQMAALLQCSRKAIETLLDSDTDLKARIQALGASPSAMAKLLIMEELKRGDVATAKWILERESRLACERERAALLRQQRRVLERAENPEQAPAGLMSEYWTKVHNYFTRRDDPKPESTEAESSGKGGTAEAADPGDQTNKTND